MSGGIIDRYADSLVENSKLVILLLLAATALVAAGPVVDDTEGGDIGQFATGWAAEAAQEEIGATYGEDEGAVTQIVVRDERGDVLTRESLLDGLYLQQEIREEDAIDATLQEDDAIGGVENVVATAAYFQQQAQSGGPVEGEPTLAEQIDALEDLDEEGFDALLDDVFDPATETPGPDATAFLPSSYEPGTTTADARLTFVFHASADSVEGGEDAVGDAQLAIDGLVDERFDDAFAFGGGITDDASTRAVGDSFAIITPVALVLVLAVLAVAYRDLVDVLVGVFGIAVVMAWLAGIQGWLSIPSSQLLIAVPFLVIGLSIDYSLHVVMRYREAREGGLRDDGPDATVPREPTAAMRLGVASVVLALAAATFSTGIGFLSNYVSPLAAIQDFALLSAGGILATLIVFGTLVPAVKLELEQLLARFGRERRNAAVGVGAGPINRTLTGVVSLVQRRPVAVLVVALLLASAGAYGATGIDTEFNQADFLPEDPPDWVKSIPGPLSPGDYDVRANAAYLGDNFRQQGAGTETQILVRGEVTGPDVLAAMDEATAPPESGSTVVARPDGNAAVDSPATVLRDVAAENDQLAAAIDARDETGNGLPDEDVVAVYNTLYDVAPERAGEVLYRSGDEYESARLFVGVQGDASAQSVADDTRMIADGIASNDAVTATATGGPVITAVQQDALLETLVQAFAVTLVVIMAFLSLLYFTRHGAPDLAIVTITPVLIALAWLLGTMSALGIPFNSETAVITSLAIGLGVDYSIHLSERIQDELVEGNGASLDEALSTAIAGTGGALRGSAATTAAGFGVLALALAPPLRRFGLVTGLSIVYAFMACVILLPVLFVLRERIREWPAGRTAEN